MGGWSREPGKGSNPERGQKGVRKGSNHRLELELCMCSHVGGRGLLPVRMAMQQGPGALGSANLNARRDPFDG